MTTAPWQIAEQQAEQTARTRTGEALPFRITSLRFIPEPYLQNYRGDSTTGGFRLEWLNASDSANVNAHLDNLEHIAIVPDGHTLASWTTEQAAHQAAQTKATWDEMARLEAIDAAAAQRRADEHVAKATAHAQSEAARMTRTLGRRVA